MLHSDLAYENSGDFCSFGDAVDAHCRKQGIPYKYPSLCHSTAIHTRLVNMSLCPVSLCNCPLVFNCDDKKYVAFAVSGKLFLIMNVLGRICSAFLLKHTFWHIELYHKNFLWIYCCLFWITYLFLVIGFCLLTLVSKECRDGIPSASSDVVILFAVFFLPRGRGQREGRRKSIWSGAFSHLCLNDNWVPLNRAEAKVGCC